MARDEGDPRRERRGPEDPERRAAAPRAPEAVRGQALDEDAVAREAQRDAEDLPGADRFAVPGEHRGSGRASLEEARPSRDAVGAPCSGASRGFLSRLPPSPEPLLVLLHSCGALRRARMFGCPDNRRRRLPHPSRAAHRCPKETLSL